VAGAGSVVSPPRAKGRARRPGRSGYVWFVGAGPGGADLITVRGLRALQRADVVLYDSLADPALLEGVTGERIFAGKRCGRHAVSQAEINALLVDLAGRGRRVVRLKGGDPTVLGRVGEEALALAEAGVAFEIVPGVTSATAVSALAGIPLTHRPVADSFHVATAHRRDGRVDLSIPRYQERTTLVLLMASRTVEAWQARLLAMGYPASLPVALLSAGCTPRQRVEVTQVGRVAAALAAAELPTPLMAVVGRVVDLHRHLARAAPPIGQDDAGHFPVSPVHGSRTVRV